MSQLIFCALILFPSCSSKYPTSKQYPAEGIYKYLSARGVAANLDMAIMQEGTIVMRIQNIQKAVTPSFFLIDTKLMTQRSKITRTEETK
jgi:hypothetical protein